MTDEKSLSKKYNLILRLNIEQQEKEEAEERSYSQNSIPLIRSEVSREPENIMKNDAITEGAITNAWNGWKVLVEEKQNNQGTT